MSPVCRVRLPGATSVVAMSVLVQWLGVASLQVTMAETAMSAVSRMWSRAVPSFLVFLVVPWAWSCVTTSVCLVMYWWCSWGRYIVRAIHDDMSVFIAFLTSDMRVVSCNVSCFLTLETSVFIIGHHVDWWGWEDYHGKLLSCIQFSTSVMASVRVWGSLL